MQEVILSSSSREKFLVRLKTVCGQTYSEKLTIIIDGPTLAYALEDKELA